MEDGCDIDPNSFAGGTPALPGGRLSNCGRALSGYYVDVLELSSFPNSLSNGDIALPIALRMPLDR